ncbi:MAG: hypothetical protein IJ092_02395, partial [Atopobiaceae bacterium]|nr:hypothetical protein [Atopobiaceae bacterium]
MDLNELASDLFGSKRAESSTQPSTVSVMYGIATSDSADGLVSVWLSDNALSPTDAQAQWETVDSYDADAYEGMDESTSIEIPTEVTCFKDDVVRVQLTGAGAAKNPTVVGVVGRGDEQNQRISDVEDAADVARANNQHFWTDTNGAHVTDEEQDDWVAEYKKSGHVTLPNPTDAKPWHNILLNSVGILLRRGLLTLVSITKNAVSFFDGTGTVTASFGPSGAQIGPENGRHAILDSNGLSVVNADGTKAPITGELSGYDIKDSTIVGSKFVDGTIEGSKIASSTITSTQISDSSITGSKIDASTFADGQISGSKIDASTFTDGQINGSKIADSTITATQIADSTITGSKIADSSITGGKIQGATLTDIPFAAITDAEIEVAAIADAEIASAHISYAQVDDLDANYAQINLANVNNAWIQNGLIKDASISDAKILGVSANKLTAGTIDAAEINVMNLRADNLKVSRVNGQPVIGGYSLVDPSGSGYASKNPKTQGWYELTANGYVLTDDTEVVSGKAYYTTSTSVELYDQDYIDGLAEDLSDRIDGAIETFTGTVVPTLNNTPASAWDTNAKKDQHIGDVYYVVNANSDQNGYCYRFTKSGSTYSWQLIKDSDVTAALSRLQTAEGKITTFDSDISTLKTDTGELKTKTQSLETSLGDKVDVTTFNELSSDVEENSATITTLSEKTETLANPNLSPFYSNKFYDGTYWSSANSPFSSELGKCFTQLEDGWAHVDFDNSERTSNAYHNIYVKQPIDHIKPDTPYTFVYEVR